MDNTLGSRIKRVRGGMFQSNFAEQLGIHKNSLSRYERDVGQPDAQFIKSICTKFDINTNWLLFGEGPMKEGDPPEARTGLEPPPKSGTAPLAGTTGCPRCKTLEDELAEERRDLKEELKENKALWKENSDLKAKLAMLEAKLEIEKVKHDCNTSNTDANIAERNCA